MTVGFRGTVAVCAMALIVSTLAGCSDGKGAGEPASGKDGADTTQAEKPPVPVTVKFAMSGSLITAEDFDTFVKVPVSKKYPHITVERIDFSQKGTTLTELVAAREIPDLYMNGALDLSQYAELGLEYSIEELIKTNKFDTARINPEILNTIKSTTGRKDLIGLPFYNQAFALFYNKDLFDKMASPYPKDNMTWEEIRDLAVKFRRDDGGVSYYGLYPDNIFRGAYQLSLPWVDVQTNKSMLQSPGWKELYELWYSLYNVPGFPPKGTDNLGLFTKGSLAMIASSATRARSMRTVPGLNWDIVTYPQNKKAPGYGARVDPNFLLIPNGAKQKEAAFKVISVMLSDEVQLDMSRHLWMSVLTSQPIHNEFGKTYPELASKNMVAFTKPKMAGIQTFGGVAAHTFANNAFDEIVYSGKDINTAMREADEKLNKALEELKQKTK
ncbi:ABC transporter substrate-binding protein [Paenibacillus hemerocallicola]|uniref:ABC transporter substrate-binding protein n=1 Tax=Paenibacillus hemerocallicola TaxID=1172614 RepID=UPI00159EC28C|nr:extracellular solute-binding protein [Paenibacillus hemerocallicola]